MRDLARALSNIKLFHYDESFVAVCDERYGTLIFQLGLYEAIERAIKAEAEVERLRLMVKSITGGLDEAVEAVNFLEAKNAKLRKVAEAVADLYSDWMEYGYMDSITSRSLITVFETWKALAELDKDHD